MRWRAAAVVGLLGLLTACGSSAGDSAAPSTLALDTPATSFVEEAPSETTPTTDAPAQPAAGELQITSEMFVSMLETEAGRSLIASSVADEIGIETQAAECLLGVIPVELLADAAGSFLSGAEPDPSLFSAEQIAELNPMLESCGVDPDALAS